MSQADLSEMIQGVLAIRRSVHFLDSFKEDLQRGNEEFSPIWEMRVKGRVGHADTGSDPREGGAPHSVLRHRGNRHRNDLISSLLAIRTTSVGHIRLSSGARKSDHNIADAHRCQRSLDNLVIYY